MTSFMSLKIIFLILILQQASCLKIDCSYPEPDFFWAAFDRAYTCDGQIQLENDDNEFVTSLNSNHRRQMSNSNVRGIAIVHQRDLSRFPRGIDRFFQNLNGIDVEGCGITRISSDDLKPFKELLQISLDENRLTELPHDLFHHNLKLKRIDIEGNLLLHVGLDIFSHLPKLAVVYMKHNSCTSENSFALRKEELKDLAWELTVECPPTLAMLTSSLFSSKIFVDNLKMISSATAEEVRGDLMVEIDELDRKIQELRRRL